MSADIFLKQAILNGEKALKLLDADDREAVNLLISAKEREAYESGKRANSEVRQLGGEIGCGSFIAVFLVLGVFFISRPKGGPTCNLEHRESISWSKRCQDKFGNEVFARECYYPSNRVFYSANIGAWKCEASSEDASSFSCKQTDTLPKEF